MAASLTTTSFVRLAASSNKALSSRHLIHKFALSGRSCRSIHTPKGAPVAAAAVTAAAFSSPPPPTHFSDLPLDRAAHLRKNPNALEQLLNDSKARTIAFYDRKALVAPLLKNTTLEEISAGCNGADGSEVPTDASALIATHAALPSTFALSFNGPNAEAPDGGPPAWIPLTWHPRNPDLVESVDQNIGFIFLGLVSSSGAPVFACRLLKLTPKLAHLLEEPHQPQQTQENEAKSTATTTTSTPPPPFASLVDVRSHGQKMIGQDAAIYALASGLLSWHSNTQFCSKSGTKTDPDSAGHARRPQLKGNLNINADAAVDGKESKSIISPPTAVKQRQPRAVYPRIDPAVIVAVTYGDWLLLGRKKTWDSGRYSLLAGFSEIGESLEDAVVREVFEESGVVVDKSTIQYHSSQPWPFPQSLMIGFLGEASHKKTSIRGKNKNIGDKIENTPLSSLLSSSLVNVTGFDIFPRGSPARTAALDVGLKAEEIEAYAVPAVHVDENEIEDARWFHRHWLLENLDLVKRKEGKKEQKGSVSQAVEFRIPGKYALANRLITDWLLGAANPLITPKITLAKDDDAINENSSFFVSPSVSSWSGYSLPDVQIDQGVFKYVLLRASDPSGFHSKLLVRGDCRAAYHNHVLTACKAEAAAVDPHQICIEVLGGGRIEHYSTTAEDGGKADGGRQKEQGERQWSDGASGVATVYGYSAAFGPAPHEITAAVLKKWDPFLDVSVSYEGY